MQIAKDNYWSGRRLHPALAAGVKMLRERAPALARTLGRALGGQLDRHVCHHRLIHPPDLRRRSWKARVHLLGTPRRGRALAKITGAMLRRLDSSERKAFSGSCARQRLQRSSPNQNVDALHRQVLLRMGNGVGLSGVR